MNNEKIAVVTDTNSSISIEESMDMGIYMVSMPFIIDGKTYYENKDLGQDEFYDFLESGADITTSQPSPGDVLDLWDELLTKYDKVLHIPMASTLSGSCDSAKMLAADYDGKVIVVDNKRVSISLRQAVYDALKYIEEGLSAEEIKEQLEKDTYEAIIYLSVDTLKYLKKGGRLSPAAAAIGSVLNIKPVLVFNCDALDPHKKTRGQKAAWKEVISSIKSSIENDFKGKDVILSSAFSGSTSYGDKWISYVRENFPEYEIENFRLPLSIATHTGPGGCGLACIVKK